MSNGRTAKDLTPAQRAVIVARTMAKREREAPRPTPAYQGTEEPRLEREADGRVLAIAPRARRFAYGRDEATALAALAATPAPREVLTAGQVLRIVGRHGWREFFEGAHTVLRHAGCRDIRWPFADGDKLGRVALAAISRLTGIGVADFGLANDMELLQRVDAALEGA